MRGGRNLRVEFTSHAIFKLRVLKRLGFEVEKTKVLQTLERPARLEKGWAGRSIAISRLNDEHLLRVVFERRRKTIVVVTLYPARRKRYES